MAGRSVDFVFYATDDQAREILAEVSIKGFGEVRLFKGTDEHGEPMTFIPVVLCFPEYSSLCPSHDQHGSSVPSRMYWASESRSSAVGTNSRVTSGTIGVMADMARLIVGWDTPSDSPISACVRLCRMYVRVATTDLKRPRHGGQFGDPAPGCTEFILMQRSMISSRSNPVV